MDRLSRIGAVTFTICMITSAIYLARPHYPRRTLQLSRPIDTRMPLPTAATYKTTTPYPPTATAWLPTPTKAKPTALPPTPTLLPATQPIPTATATIVTQLPCSQFTFVPGTLALTTDAKQALDECVIPVLKTLPNLYLRVRATAAWPGPAGKFTQHQIQNTAHQRARAVANYLIAQGFDPARFVIEGALPPEAHRETLDAAILNTDRRVELTLITAGR